MKSLLKYLKNYKKESVFAPLFKMLEASFGIICAFSSGENNR